MEDRGPVKVSCPGSSQPFNSQLHFSRVFLRRTYEHVRRKNKERLDREPYRYLESKRVVLVIAVLFLGGLTFTPAARAELTEGTIVYHFNETRSGLPCLDPSAMGSGTFSSTDMIHFTLNSGTYYREQTATENFNYTMPGGTVFLGHDTFHTTLRVVNGILVARIFSWNGEAQASDGILIAWSILTVSNGGNVLQDQFVCRASS